MPVVQQRRKSRWYDPYPRLSFALQLLDLSPEPLRVQAWEMVILETESTLSQLVQEASDKVRPERTLDRIMANWQRSQKEDERQWLLENRKPRHYDQVHLGAHALLMLKNSPDAVKVKITERLLTLLNQS